eukprot:TRINITY_DN3372_c0_g1_i2.p1 TRINITY_DN3372_c0_g1~~TRINITY_DN3372_c0_g1_i2.p1  ORF type:complete len:447 (-),score=103.21 TRINITY_DN3372_c0_g1_i2:41-1381(-)
MDRETQTLVKSIANLPLEHKSHPELAFEVSKLRNMAKEIISRLSASEEASSDKQRKKAKQRDFDMSKHSIRHIALKIAYIGENYQGFASQETTETTIEGQLFQALKKVCLIEDRESCHYSRCGRTDKGVSALSQVVSLHLRSNCTEGVGMIRAVEKQTPKKGSNSDVELDYVSILNRVLPDDIRVLGWAPVPANFDARFSCLYRLYRYYFSKGKLDVSKMVEASKFLVGEHDFRNFCKMDYMNVSNFKRRVLSVQIVECPEKSTNPEDQMFYFEVSGFAFLWHQVRCMMSVLFLVGEGVESPEIIRDLLDLERYPRKPQYPIAPELPLILYDCGYEGLEFNHSPDALERLYAHATTHIRENRIRSQLFSTILQHATLSPIEIPQSQEQQPSATRICWCDLPKESKPINHIPLSKRKTEETYEERIASLPAHKQQQLKRKHEECDGE